ncbi:MAG TPA: DUF1648 domain-containing protein [Pyrinomonadaceae bacterium]|nr:DUF1648 domain-containing protein [Pyrinomonadaceae bacterium]
MRLSLISIFFLVGIFVAQALFYYNGLPDLIASHFDAAGRPDAWMTKPGFFLFEFAFLSFLLVTFLSVPVLVGRLPVRLINLPNREFWFSEDKRKETLRTIRVSFEWFAALLLMMFIAVNQMVFEANINGRTLWTAGIWIILVVYLLVVLIWMIAFVRRFRLPRN